MSEPDQTEPEFTFNPQVPDAEPETAEPQPEQVAPPADGPPAESPAEQDQSREEIVPGAKFGSKIVNAPSVPNSGGYENRTVTARAGADKMAGQNSGGFENRVVQESGTH